MDDHQTVIRFLAKLAQKGKGGVNINLVFEAFAQMEGWSIKQVCSPLEMWRSYDARRVLCDSIPGCRFVHRDCDRVKCKELKTLHVGFETPDAVVPGLKHMKDTFKVVTGTPTDVVPGGIYLSRIGGPNQLVSVGLAWLGVVAWEITAPSGAQTFVKAPIKYRPEHEPFFETFASFWTFVYKQGINAHAKQALDAMGSDYLAKSKMTKKERERNEAKRRHIPEIAKIFRDTTEDRFQAVVDYLTKLYIRNATRYVEMRNANDRGYRLVWVSSNLYTYERGNYCLAPDYKKKAAKLAHQDATSAREEFVHKNTTRISVIAKLKADTTPTFEVVRVLHDEGVAGYGGEIKFAFKDGSSFTLRNKTIWKTSSLGNHFAQFPTTFHNVVLPDGSQMPAPASESRMRTVFAGAKS